MFQNRVTVFLKPANSQEANFVNFKHFTVPINGLFTLLADSE